MPSKMVLDRQKSAATVIGTGEAHAREIATRLRELLRDYLAEGETLPDVELLLTVVLRYLQGADDMMGMADDMHRRELEKDRNPRRQRTEATRQLYQLMVELREIATGFFGSPALPQLGFRGPTPQDPAQLLRYAGEVVAAMTENPLPPSRVKGVSLNALDWVWRIKQARAALDAALKAVARGETKQAGGTLERKNAAIVEFDERLHGTAAFVSGLLRLVGDEDAATKVRRALRRYGKSQSDTSKEDGEDGAEEAESSGEDRADAEEGAAPPSVRSEAPPNASPETSDPAASGKHAETSSKG